MTIDKWLPDNPPAHLTASVIRCCACGAIRLVDTWCIATDECRQRGQQEADRINSFVASGGQ